MNRANWEQDMLSLINATLRFFSFVGWVEVKRNPTIQCLYFVGLESATQPTRLSGERLTFTDKMIFQDPTPNMTPILCILCPPSVDIR